MGTKHFTVRVLHTLNNIVAKDFNQIAPSVRTIIVALDMNKAFDPINIHTNQKAATDKYSIHKHDVYRKLHQGTQPLHNIQKPHIHATPI